MKINEHIKNIRNKKGITTYKLAEMTGIPQSTISKIENGKRRIDSDSLQKITKALEIPISTIFQDESSIEAEVLLVKESTVYDSINVNKSNITNIPIVGTVRAGEPILAQENITGYSPVLNKFISRDKNYFYLRVQGDSMNQEFNEGDLLLIEQTDYIENGDIAVVLIDGQEATVKKVIKNENMVTLIPMSTNPKYVPKMYDVVKDEIKIIGKVIQATKIY